jgi:predicted hydrolase (HD superfamily)
MSARKQALSLIEEHVENKNIIKHMLALEAVMGVLWKKLKIDGKKEEWMMAGLLHDGDYCESVSMEKQGIEITNWAKEKGYEIPENVAHAMAAHNWANTNVEPKNSMDWSIFCADSLTGLIVACALVLPSKKLSDVTPKMVLKKFGQKSFAGGTRREDIFRCEEKLGIKLSDFIQISLSAMQEVHEELGL